ncbi:hypothetical protein AT251_10025 [Enterovibrio nigricans]|nr:hypothetical protein [Enterovibrio nigricans]PKF50649.1 hypothetical protein AT251_10025 [Enterovibrio nigricans]
MKKFLFVVLSTLALIGCDDDSSTSSDNDVISPDPVEVNALVSSPTNAEDAGLEEYYGHAINPVPITPHEVPDHPFMSKIKSGLHFDHYNSDVSNNLGPLGEGELDIKTWQISPIVSACPTVMFSEEGDLITVCIEINQTRLFLLDQYTLETKAEFLLPKKQNPGGGDSSGGGYVRMDEQNRVLVNNTDDTIRYIALEKDEDGEYEFVEEKVIDISAKLKNAGLTGYLNDANPDHEGRIWFTLGTGEVGYIGPNEYVLKYHDFGERLQNQTAMDAEGLYVVTSGTTVNPDTGWISKLVTDQYGNLVIDWTSSYDNSGDGVLARYREQRLPCSA